MQPQLAPSVRTTLFPRERPTDQEIIDACRARRRRPNVVLMLITTGGDADAAYRIARALQRYYTRFIVYLPGYCKSAGTLVATGAHELVIGDHGELGPLDVQMRKADELFETSSGLTVMEAMNTLENTAYRMLETCFLRIKAGSSGQITFKTATDVAVAMVTGLLEPLYRQIDPMHLGEAGRSMSVGRDYGERLSQVGKNLKENALASIVAGFSSHSFVIDREEAAAYFERVRAPEADEDALAVALGNAARIPLEEQVWGFLTDEIPLQGGEEVSGDGQATELQVGGGGNGRREAEVAGAARDVGNPGEPLGDEGGE